jgi:hypothetical protein
MWEQCVSNKKTRGTCVPRPDRSMTVPDNLLRQEPPLQLSCLYLMFPSVYVHGGALAHPPWTWSVTAPLRPRYEVREDSSLFSRAGSMPVVAEPPQEYSHNDRVADKPIRSHDNCSNTIVLTGRAAEPVLPAWGRGEPIALAGGSRRQGHKSQKPQDYSLSYAQRCT